MDLFPYSLFSFHLRAHAAADAAREFPQSDDHLLGHSAGPGLGGHDHRLLGMETDAGTAAKGGGGAEGAVRQSGLLTVEHPKSAFSLNFCLFIFIFLLKNLIPKLQH